MPLFDLPPDQQYGLAPDFVAGVNGVIERFRSSTIASLSITGAERTANLIRAYSQAHIRRCVEFIEGGYAEFRAGRCLAAQACARANYENVASFCDFAKKLLPLLEVGDHSAIQDFVNKRAFWTRIPSILAEHGDDILAVNIVTQIDAMNKKYPEFRKAYDHLSDFVHPNGMGAVVHFVSIDNGVATFHSCGKNPEWAYHELVSSGFLLAHVEIAIGEIEQRLKGLGPYDPPSTSTPA
jgi:hypothetical protein